MKTLRGTKRVCHACAARFYDLSREQIICPSCGMHYVPEAPPWPLKRERGPRALRTRQGWRSRSLKPPDPQPDVAPDVASTEDTNEEAFTPATNDDVVLEEEPDQADISGLVGHHESDDPKER